MLNWNYHKTISKLCYLKRGRWNTKQCKKLQWHIQQEYSPEQVANDIADTTVMCCEMLTNFHIIFYLQKMKYLNGKVRKINFLLNFICKHKCKNKGFLLIDNKNIELDDV